MNLTSRALLDATKRGLQGLYLADGRMFASSDIQSILHLGKDLRSFKSFISPTVMATDVVLAQWICEWMTVFSIHIGGTPRPDSERNYNLDETGEQGQVYYDPLFQTNCLELSRASGLESLEGLTNIQFLDVSFIFMAHRIGEDKLRWMDRRFHTLTLFSVTQVGQ
ncbi:hypothetical protein BGX24_000184 [Mortierella sp. AD032]|nr:hypothetical protein BGX24_000184 [Mortierella sp. AD032]